jgi:2-polyprenyl-6-hydroxyphenyl methylase/3-demethylubiquinone-9 3-methyltransferase
MFIKPREVEETLRRHGLEPRGTAGLVPKGNPLRLLRDLRRRRKGEITYAELGRRMEMRESRDRSNEYAGYALKPGG